MGFKWDTIYVPKNAVLFKAGDPGVVMDQGMYARGYHVHNKPWRNTQALVAIDGLNGNGKWNLIATLPHDHARHLAYLLLLATSGPLERAAVIADAKAEGLDIGGITSPTP